MTRKVTLFLSCLDIQHALPIQELQYNLHECAAKILVNIHSSVFQFRLYCIVKSQITVGTVLNHKTITNRVIKKFRLTVVL